MGGAKVILATAPNAKVISQLLDGLTTGGELIVVAGSGEKLDFSPAQFLSGHKIFRGWTAGPAKSSEETIAYTVLTDVHPMVEVFPLEDAEEGFERMMQATVRFRSVLRRIVLFKHRAFATTSLLLITLVWGATFTLTKNALVHVDVYPFLFIRFLLATLALICIVLFIPKSRQSFDRKTIGLGTFLGLLLFGAYAFQTVGLGTIDPAIAGFLTGLNVVLVPLFSIPLYRTAPGLPTWIGTVVAAFGLWLLSGANLANLRAGDMEILICAIFLALQILSIEKWGGDIDSLALATVEIAVVMVCSGLGSLVQGRNEILDVHLWVQPSVFWAVVINALLGTSLAYWGQNVFQQQISSAQIAIIFSMEPVFAALIAWLASAHALTVVELLGGLCILLSMFIADPSISLKRRD